MFCVVKRSKIWESEVQRANRIYCVRRAERSDSGVRVQRALRISEKFIHIIPFLVGFLLLYLHHKGISVGHFFVLKNGRGAGGEFHFSKLLINFLQKSPHQFLSPHKRYLLVPQRHIDALSLQACFRL